MQVQGPTFAVFVCVPRRLVGLDRNLEAWQLEPNRTGGDSSLNSVARVRELLAILDHAYVDAPLDPAHAQSEIKPECA